VRSVLLAVWIVLVPVSAHADDPANPFLDDALAEKTKLQYAKALDLLDQAIAWGRNGPAEIARIYRLGGEMAAGIEDGARARRYFERLLALRPDTAMPAGTSPKITAPFDAARASMTERGALAVRHEIEVGPMVVLVIENDPLSMVAGARVRYRADGGEETVVEGRGKERIRVALPRAHGLDATVAAIDEYGNELIRIDTVIQPAAPPGQIVPTPIPTPAPATTSARPHPKWPYVGGLALAFAGVGVYFGLDARDAQDEFDTLKERSRTGAPVEASRLLELQDRGERSALIANIGFATAGVTAAVATWLLVRHVRSEPEAPTVTAAPIPGGAALTFSARF